MRTKSILTAINVISLVARVTSWTGFKWDITVPSPRRELGCIGEEGVPDTSYDDSLCDDLHVLQEEIDRKEIATIHFLLENFTIRLRNFVNEANFDLTGFKAEEKNLEEKLSEIRTKADKFSFDLKIREHFLFNLIYLDLLRDSVRYLECFYSGDFLGNHLVCRMIDLYVRSFTFQTRSHEFDTRFWDYKSKAIWLARSLSLLKAEFSELEQEKHILFPVRLMFHDHAERTSEILEACATRIFTEGEKFEKNRKWR